MIDGVIREELGKSARELFATFSEAPIAAASLAQVHTATLRDGTPVAVKVQYPELRLNMASDLSVFRTMGAQVRGLARRRNTKQCIHPSLMYRCARRSSRAAWTSPGWWTTSSRSSPWRRAPPAMQPSSVRPAR